MPALDTKGYNHVSYKPWHKDRRYTEVWVSKDGQSWKMLGMEGPSRCKTCGRLLIPWARAEAGDPAMDCGGDCLACVEAAEAEDPRPPLIVGYREDPFLRVGDRPTRYYCGSDAPRVEWPTVMVPVWRGEVPEDASCEVCGLALTEFE